MRDSTELSRVGSAILLTFIAERLRIVLLEWNAGQSPKLARVHVSVTISQ